MSPVRYSRTLTPQNYSQISISRKHKPTVEMWTFAARYSFLELESYCRLQSPYISILLKTILTDPTRGLVGLSRLQISQDILNIVVMDLVARSISNPSPSYCLKCRRGCGADICVACKRDGWSEMIRYTGREGG